MRIYANFRLFLTLLFFFFIFNFNITEVNAVTCGSPGCECTGSNSAGTLYCCNGGDMCCSGVGCPSWYCLNTDGWDCSYKATGLCSCTRCENGACIAWNGCKTWSSRLKCVDLDGDGIMECWTVWVCISYNCAEYEKICESMTKTADQTVGTCAFCPTDPPPPACSSIPGVPPLNSPTNGQVFDGVNNIAFQWKDPSSWGSCEAGVNYTFRLQVDNESSFSTPLVHNTQYNLSSVVVGSITSGIDTFRKNLVLPDLGNYFWRVQACNAAGCSAFSPAWSVNLICGTDPTAPKNISPTNGEIDVVAPVTLEWDKPDSWGTACASTAPNSRTFTVFAKYQPTGACDSAGSSYNPVPGCQNLGENARTCSGLTTIRNRNYCWYVVADNGTFSKASDPWTFKTEDPLLEQNWVTTVGGDFYSGSLSMLLPLVEAQISPWKPAYTVYNAPDGFTANGLPVASIVNGDVLIESSDLHPQAESNFYVEHAAYVNTWPSSYDGDPPSTAKELPGIYAASCATIFTDSKLDPFDVYKGDVACIAEGMAAVADNYRLGSEGYAVVYVTGSGDLNITKEFTTNNDNYRIAFVTGTDVTVRVSRLVGTDTDPIRDSPAQIEAAFVVANKYITAGTTDEKTSPDKTLVVEGPLVARAIEFNRNRGSTNQFPSEIVRYNSNYIYNLTEQERASDKSNESGLFVIDIDWLGEN